MVKIIYTLDALDNIFKTNNFNFLKEHILDSEEISLISKNNYAINYLNGKNLKNNLYSDLDINSTLKWLGIFNNDNSLIGLQLINISNHFIELIIIEKNNKIKTNNSIFQEVIEFCKSNYNMSIITFPENDKLKEYYKSFGFIDYSNMDNYIILNI